MVLNENGKSTGVFVPFRSKKRETQAKRGFVEGFVKVTAMVAYSGGFSPTASIVSAKEVGTGKPVTIVSTDRFQDGL